MGAKEFLELYQQGGLFYRLLGATSAYKREIRKHTTEKLIKAVLEELETGKEVNLYNKRILDRYNKILSECSIFDWNAYNDDNIYRDIETELDNLSDQEQQKKYIKRLLRTFATTEKGGHDIINLLEAIQKEPKSIKEIEAEQEAGTAHKEYAEQAHQMVILFLERLYILLQGYDIDLIEILEKTGITLPTNIRREWYFKWKPQQQKDTGAEYELTAKELEFFNRAVEVEYLEIIEGEYRIKEGKITLIGGLIIELYKRDKPNYKRLANKLGVTDKQLREAIKNINRTGNSRSEELREQVNKDLSDLISKYKRK